jgi:hypothetical protein
VKLVDIRDPDAFALAVEAMQRAPIVVQLPTVFVLLAAPTLRGAEALNDTKSRLAGKNYGTAIGSLELFLAQADASQLPVEFNAPAQFARMAGSFIRLQFRRPDFQSETIRDGTHQGLLLEGVHRELFRRLEASFVGGPPDRIWGHHPYSAPLCTSCNVSGDAEGSIVEIDKALAFGRDRGIRLMLTCPDRPAELGSYPILGYTRDKVHVHRDGPGLEAFKRRIPGALRGW